MADDAEATEGRFLADDDGTERYLGETSGATFLDHLKTFMRQMVSLSFQPDLGEGSSFVTSIGRYQTFDSRPLANPDGKAFLFIEHIYDEADITNVTKLIPYGYHHRRE